MVEPRQPEDVDGVALRIRASDFTAEELPMGSFESLGEEVDFSMSSYRHADDRSDHGTGIRSNRPFGGASHPEDGAILLANSARTC
jgi:hypothetical protein